MSISLSSKIFDFRWSLYNPFENTVTSNDAIGISLCILALFVAHYKLRKGKDQETMQDTSKTMRPIKVRITEHDIFGLPKKNQGRRNTQQDIPFTNFSLKQAYWVLALLIIVSLFISAFRQYS